MASAWPRSWQIDEADHRPAEFLRDFHAPQRLAISLRAGHAEVALDALLEQAALADADHQHLFAVQPRHAASQRLVVAKGAIPVNLAEVGEDSFDEVHGSGALRMPRPLNIDPRRRRGLRLVGISCLLFAHLFLVPCPVPWAASVAARPPVILRVRAHPDKCRVPALSREARCTGGQSVPGSILGATYRTRPRGRDGRTLGLGRVARSLPQ